ncbi:beta-galactosidase [Paenibacillus sp. LHD-117]|uniref:beta-galactosidase n=1 Tax=Paenibacillus sp. LHD-117 TaxID=3071412 RepID=UPI0027DF80A1|nr:beta-galactosidase [Paenibacillus sp. LHD-117]MDQ6420499.1 beta-galactosidase [Paenibacillus sp. LHD-117]
MTIYHFPLPTDVLQPAEGHLRMGGISPQGELLSVNSRYFTRNGRPWVPIMGEIHYTRVPQNEWRDALLKMRAGGITVVASYSIWLHHEEHPGQIRFDGNRDLRNFVKLCAELGLYFWARIGPWIHGEVRNGGFPDWVARMPNTRTNDELYLSVVQRWFNSLSAQLQGLMHHQGGPVIGIQIENELSDHPEHLGMLKSMAVKAGLITPYWTVTGWSGDGGTRFPEEEFIPVFGGYPEAPWEPHTDPLPPSPHYFFHGVRNDSQIGNDLFDTVGIRSEFSRPDLDRYPFATCELGGGVQMTWHRRPVIRPEDVASIALVRMGSGNNLPGYYMYHGGTNPVDEAGPTQESKATGYPNDYPEYSYDFQAPIREFGQLSEAFYALRPLHQFLLDFGDRFAPTVVVFPPIQPRNMSDTTTPRYAARWDGSSGWLFWNNYHRNQSCGDTEPLQFALHYDGRTLMLPEKPVSIPSGCYGFWPLGMDLEGIRLVHATAQPLMRLEGSEPTWVFLIHEGIEAEYVWPQGTQLHGVESSPCEEGVRCGPGTSGIFKVEYPDGRCARILSLSDKLAKLAIKVDWQGLQRIVTGSQGLLPVADGVRIYGSPDELNDVWVYPPLLETLETYGEYLHRPNQDGIWTRIGFQSPSCLLNVNIRELPSLSERTPDTFRRIRVFVLSVTAASPLPAQMKGVRLKIEYAGDRASLSMGGEILSDHYWNGTPWEVDVRRDLRSGEEILLQFSVTQRLKSDKVYVESKEVVPPEGWCEFRSVKAKPVMDIRIG